MNDPLDRISVSPMFTRNNTLEQDVDLFEALGLRRASISSRKLEASGADGITTASEAGFAIDLIHCGRWFELADPRQWGKVRDHTFWSIDAAAALDARGVLVVSGGAAGLPWTDAVAAYDRAFEPVVNHARACEVTLYIEATTPLFAFLTFAYTFQEAIELADRFELGVICDLAQSWWERDLVATAAAVFSRIGAVQVADRALSTSSLDRDPPGDGNLPISRLLDELLDSGYEGLIEIEAQGAALEAEGYGHALRRSVAWVAAALERHASPVQ